MMPASAAERYGLVKLDKASALAAITNSTAEIARIEALRQKMVTIATTQLAASWTEVGAALGTSKQNAHQKFRR